MQDKSCSKDTDNPNIQPPSKTSVDDFLTSRTPKAAAAKHPNIRSSRQNIKPGKSWNSVTPTSATIGNRQRNVHNNHDSSLQSQPVTKEAEASTVVSPLISQSSKTGPANVPHKMSRKSLNKLKRKRLEETSNSCQTELAFSSFANLQVDLRYLGSPNVNGSAHHSNAVGIIMNLLRNGTLNACELISLDIKDLRRWPLLNGISALGPSKEMNDGDHFDFIQQSQMSSIHKFSVNTIGNTNPGPNTDDRDRTLSIETIAIMLHTMQAGLSFSYKPKNNVWGLQEEVFSGGTFVLIPDNFYREKNNMNSNGIQSFILLCNIQDELMSNISPQCISTESESKADQHMKDLPKRSKTTQSDPIKRPTSRSKPIPAKTKDENLFKPVPWEDLIVMYKSCLSQEADSLSPLAFVKEPFDAAIKTLWQESNKENTTKPSNDDRLVLPVDAAHKITSLPQLFERLRPTIEVNGDEEFRRPSVLKSKSDLYVIIRNRERPLMPKTIYNSSKISDLKPKNKSEDHELDSVDYSTSNSPPPTSAIPNEYVNMILLQVLTRLQLQTLYSSNEKTHRCFLKSFAKCIQSAEAADQKRKGKKGKLKSKKATRYSAHDFAMEVCSVLELVPFVLPSTESFTAFLVKQVLEPYRSTAPIVVEIIADFFEIDLGDNLNIEDSDGSNDEGVNAEKDVEMKKKPSRWENPVITKADELASTTGSYMKLPTQQPNAASKKTEPESEETILLKNKNDLAIKTKGSNPLLADSKGRYVGRQFSNNYFRLVKVTKTEKPKSKLKKPTSRILSTEMAMAKRINQEEPNLPKVLQSSNAVARLGASSSSFRSRQSAKESLTKRPNHPKDEMPPPARHPHAAVFAALAAIRKKK